MPALPDMKAYTSVLQEREHLAFHTLMAMIHNLDAMGCLHLTLPYSNTKISTYYQMVNKTHITTNREIVNLSLLLS